jgi:hypothetical protein
MRPAPRREDRPGPKFLRVLDKVPDDDLRAFSRAWNRACFGLAIAGLIAVAAVLLLG